MNKTYQKPNIKIIKIHSRLLESNSNTGIDHAAGSREYRSIWDEEEEEDDTGGVDSN